MNIFAEMKDLVDNNISSIFSREDVLAIIEKLERTSKEESLKTNEIPEKFFSCLQDYFEMGPFYDALDIKVDEADITVNKKYTGGLDLNIDHIPVFIKSAVVIKHLKKALLNY